MKKQLSSLGGIDGSKLFEFEKGKEITYDILSDEEKHHLDTLLTMIINKYVDDQLSLDLKQLDKGIC